MLKADLDSTAVEQPSVYSWKKSMMIHVQPNRQTDRRQQTPVDMKTDKEPTTQQVCINVTPSQTKTTPHTKPKDLLSKKILQFKAQSFQYFLFQSERGPSNPSNNDSPAILQTNFHCVPAYPVQLLLFAFPNVHRDIWPYTGTPQGCHPLPVV